MRLSEFITKNQADEESTLEYARDIFGIQDDGEMTEIQEEFLKFLLSLVDIKDVEIQDVKSFYEHIGNNKDKLNIDYYDSFCSSRIAYDELELKDFLLDLLLESRIDLLMYIDIDRYKDDYLVNSEIEQYSGGYYDLSII